VLRRYQKAVQREMGKGARFPMKMSEYLEAARARGAARRAGTTEVVRSQAETRATDTR
jgi:hypothetical protein